MGKKVVGYNEKQYEYLVGVSEKETDDRYE